MSKRRRGYPSETRVKAGVRIVHGEKFLEEKLPGRKTRPQRQLPLWQWIALQTLLPEIRALLTG